MNIRRARHPRLLAAGTCGILSLTALTACASGSVPSTATLAASSSASAVATASSAPATSATPRPTGELPAPTASGAVPSEQPSNGPNAITSPAPGATVDGPDVTMTGTGTGFEGTLLWEVVPAAGGDPITHGLTTAGANGEIGPFTVTTTLAAGRVALSVWEPDMSGAAAGKTRHNLVTVTFTVR
jgi:hypothetical protein